VVENTKLGGGKSPTRGAGRQDFTCPQFKWLKAQWMGQDIFKIYQQREATGKGKELSPAKAATG
jgi:hypothetical protein